MSEDILAQLRTWADDFDKDWGTASEGSALIHMAIAEIERLSVDVDGGWVPVGTKMSPVGKMCQLAAFDGSVIAGWRRSEPGRNHNHWQQANGVVRKVVTHWKPLSNPPNNSDKGK